MKNNSNYKTTREFAELKNHKKVQKRKGINNFPEASIYSYVLETPTHVFVVKTYTKIAK